MISSTSSRANRLETSPLARTLFMYSEEEEEEKEDKEWRRGRRGGGEDVVDERG